MATAVGKIDDVHFLDLSDKEGKLANDHLKQLANHTAATFLYAGVDQEASGLFLEGRAKTRGTQTAGRNDLYHVTPFKITTQDRVREWASVIASMETHLALYRHQSGSLHRQHWRYLHQRTGGSIASLSHLLRESAVQAVSDGTEAVTRDIMDRIVIDRQAEEHFITARRRAIADKRAGLAKHAASRRHLPKTKPLERRCVRCGADESCGLGGEPLSGLVLPSRSPSGPVSAVGS